MYVKMLLQSWYCHLKGRETHKDLHALGCSRESCGRFWFSYVERPDELCRALYKLYWHHTYLQSQRNSVAQKVCIHQWTLPKLEHKVRLHLLTTDFLSISNTNNYLNPSKAT